VNTAQDADDLVRAAERFVAVIEVRLGFAGEVTP
jgi:hypothetical protein